MSTAGSCDSRAEGRSCFAAAYLCCGQRELRLPFRDRSSSTNARLDTRCIFPASTTQQFERNLLLVMGFLGIVSGLGVVVLPGYRSPYRRVTGRTMWWIWMALNAALISLLVDSEPPWDIAPKQLRDACLAIYFLAVCVLGLWTHFS